MEMSMNRVKGKVAFITGVARGQGRSHAVRLAEEGADIIGVDALVDFGTMPYPMGTQDDLEETARLIDKTGRTALLSRADVRDRDALQQAVSAGVAELGRLDIVCANAGISPPGGPVWTIPTQQWQDVIDINLTGVFNTLAVTVPAIQAAGNGGSIIVTSSGAGLRSAQNLGDYNSSKHGVVGLALTLANEVAREGIRVNVIAPGTVGTPMVTANDAQFKVFRPDLENPTLDDCRSIFEMIMPMGNAWVDPEDISNAIVFLASDEARYVTGIVMPVDQGSNNRVF
jgi:(+)-trans-carveol dehydrogenase